MEYFNSDVAAKMIKANTALIDSAARMSSVAMDTQGRVARHQMALVEKWVEAGSKQMALLEDVRNPADLVTKSSAIATDLGQEVAVMMREAMELQAELGAAMTTAMQEEFANFTAAAAKDESAA